MNTLVNFGSAQPSKTGQFSFGGNNITIYSQNQRTQADIALRAQYIQQSVQMQPLYQEMIKALADLSVHKQDRALSELLTRQGITVTVNTTAAAPPAPVPKVVTPANGKKGVTR